MQQSYIQVNSDDYKVTVPHLGTNYIDIISKVVCDADK